MSDRAPPRATTSAGPALVQLCLWLAVIAWGGSFVAARVLLHADAPGTVTLDPTVLAAARFILASAFFAPPLARAVLRRELSGRDLLRLAILGQITYSLYFWLQYTGVQQTNASIASVLVVGLIPVVTAFLSQLLNKERLRPARFGALTLGLGGVAAIALQQPVGVSGRAGFILGVLCLLGNAVAFALYSNLSKRWMRTITPLALTGGTMVSGALGLLLLSLAGPTRDRWAAVARLNGQQLIALLFLALVCSVAAYFAYNFALTRVPASRAAVYIYFEPVVAVALGVTLLGERLSRQTILGAALIAASVALVTLLRT